MKKVETNCFYATMACKTMKSKNTDAQINQGHVNVITRLNYYLWHIRRYDAKEKSNLAKNNS